MNDKLELRNDEVRDILQKMPHWIIRWGISIVFAALVLLLVFSWVYRYPDLIKSTVVISAQNPPAELKARATGKITGLFVDDGQQVVKGDLLAMIENPAILDHVLELDSCLDSFENYLLSFDEENFTALSRSLTLGEVQAEYSAFSRLVDDYQNVINSNYHQQQIDAIRGQIRKQRKLLSQLNSQLSIKAQQLELSRKSFERDSQLFTKKVISPEAYEQSQKNALSIQFDYQNLKSTIVSNESVIYQLQQNRSALAQQYRNSLVDYQLSIINSFELVQSSIDRWKMSYLIESPIDGTVSMGQIWAANQNVNLGETVVTIVPSNPQRIVGKAFVPTKGAGKVQPGQRVNIKLENYPYMEYGMLIGTVKRKAPIPNDERYAIEISLPAQLTTNYNRTLDMQQELWGNCEIITNDLRLIQRFLNPIRAALKGNRR